MVLLTARRGCIVFFYIRLQWRLLLNRETNMKNTREQGEKVLNVQLIIVVFSVSALHTDVKFQIVLAPVILYLRKSLFLIMLSICNQYLYLVTVSAWNVICVKKMWSEYNGSVFFLFFFFALLYTERVIDTILKMLHFYWTFCCCHRLVTVTTWARNFTH